MERTTGETEAARRRLNPLTALFDAECRWCRNAVARWSRLNERQAVRFVPLQHEDETRALGVEPEEARRAIHAVESGGKVHRGAAAVAEIFLRLPKRRRVGQLLRLPVVGRAAQAVYALIARMRPRKKRPRPKKPRNDCC